MKEELLTTDDAYMKLLQEHLVILKEYAELMAQHTALQDKCILLLKEKMEGLV